LPKPNPKDVISELKSTLYSNDNFRRFFPDEREQKYKDNFKLFDRNIDGILSFDEL
jgi:Ca2+-binding EF-hand superfamily protein